MARSIPPAVLTWKQAGRTVEDDRFNGKHSYYCLCPAFVFIARKSLFFRMYLQYVRFHPRSSRSPTSPPASPSCYCHRVDRTIRTTGTALTKPHLRSCSCPGCQHTHFQNPRFVDLTFSSSCASVFRTSAAVGRAFGSLSQQALIKDFANSVALEPPGHWNSGGKSGRSPSATWRASEIGQALDVVRGGSYCAEILHAEPAVPYPNIRHVRGRLAW